ncbi:MAG TPA: hypothetical protein VMR50_17755 [Myxococcota bacterium]|nr:hypothetical protein [Myxococcota bacterium]
MKTRMRVLGLVAGAAALMATGCGNLTIRSWVKVVTANSSGTLQSDLLGPNAVPINRLQGGFLGAIALDTSTLPAPLDGTVAVDKVKIAGDTNGPDVFSAVGMVCVWGDPNNPSSGTIHLDILSNTGSTTLNLNLRATASISDELGVAPVGLSQTATFPLGGIGLSQLTNASTTGSADGLFATSASFTGTTTLLDHPATFSLSLAVNNESTPPIFDADLAAECGPHFAEQGNDIFYGVNSKSSYLEAGAVDQPQPPVVIALADIGAKAGDRLKIARVGTWDETTELKDGNSTAAGAVFSSSNVILGTNQRNRVKGALHTAAPNYVTGGFTIACIIWPFCTIETTDIPQDFAIANSPTVTIPTGAKYLVIGTTSKTLTWGDNSGFGFGVALTVNP